MEWLVVDYGLIIKVYIERLFVLIVVIYFVVRVLNKKTIINPKNAIPSKREVIIKYNKKLDLIARICMIIYTVYALPFVLFPAIMDIPYIAQERCITIECKTISHDNVGDIDKIRTIQVINLKTNETLFLKVNYSPIQENEYFVIEYIPHLRIGKIIGKG